MRWIYSICFILLCGGFFSLFGVNARDALGSIGQRRSVTLDDELKVITGVPVKKFFNRDYEIGQILRDTGRESQFDFIKKLSLILFALGGALAMTIGNIYMAPVLCLGFSLAPLWYLRATADTYKKHLNEELEMALSIVTTSYLRTEDLTRSVKENIPSINEPIRAIFEAFVFETEMINANLISAINSLKMKIPNRVFHEWANTMIQCQSDRMLKNILPSIIQKLSDIRAVQAELEAIAQGPRREAITMVFLVIVNIPLLYFLNKDWFNTLVFSAPGKITLAVCSGAIFFALSRVMSLSKPIEYGG